MLERETGLRPGSSVTRLLFLWARDSPVPSLRRRSESSLSVVRSGKRANGTADDDDYAGGAAAVVAVGDRLLCAGR